MKYNIGDLITNNIDLDITTVDDGEELLEPGSIFLVQGITNRKHEEYTLYCQQTGSFSYWPIYLLEQEKSYFNKVEI